MAETSPIQPTSTNTSTTSTQSSSSQSTTQQQATPSTIYPSLDQLKAVLPQADVQNLQKYAPIVLKEMAEWGFTSRGDLIGMIATIGVETGQFAPIEEYPGTPNREPVYFGRGFIQLTGPGNYKGFGEFMKQDFLSRPEAVLDPVLSAKSSCWFWKTNGVSQYAQAFDWQNVRSIVNAGHTGSWGDCWGKEAYMGYIEAGLKNFPSGIDPKSLGALPMSGNYGNGCIDTNGAGSRTLSASLNPSSFADALAYALGIHALERSKSHEFRAILDVAADPKGIMGLDAQKTFLVQGIGDGLDGDYTCEEVNFVLTDNGLQAEVIGFKPDPNAPPVQIFNHNANGSTPAIQMASATTPGQSVIGNDEVKLAVPYYKQKENTLNPDGSCNATSIAMALEFLGIKASGGQRLPDELYAKLASRGLPGAADLMKGIVEEYGKKDVYSAATSDDEIRAHLKKGMPAVIHGDFTGPGHIICVIGFNSTGFWVNDPWFKFVGPNVNDYDFSASGQDNHHPYATTVTKIWHQNGANWAHLISN